MTRNRDPIGRAPRTSGPSLASAGDLSERTLELVTQLASGFREQVRRSLGVELDGSTTSLAFVDHHLQQARDEARSEVLGLLAAGAGAYFGELVRDEVGARWIGDGRDPRRLRLLLIPQFVYFSPVDQALEAIAGETLDPDDPRIPPGPELDATFHLAPVPEDDQDDDPHDSNWLRERLGELPPIPVDQYHSLTCRFETLELMLELLATKQVGEGRTPHEHDVDDYIAVLSRV